MGACILPNAAGADPTNWGDVGVDRRGQWSQAGIEALDAIAGTPVIAIKPVMAGLLPRGEVREPAWAAEIRAGYWDGPVQEG